MKLRLVLAVWVLAAPPGAMAAAVAVREKPGIPKVWVDFVSVPGSPGLDLARGLGIDPADGAARDALAEVLSRSMSPAALPLKGSPEEIKEAVIRPLNDYVRSLTWRAYECRQHAPQAKEAGELAAELEAVIRVLGAVSPDLREGVLFDFLEAKTGFTGVSMQGFAEEIDRIVSLWDAPGIDPGERAATNADRSALGAELMVGLVRGTGADLHYKAVRQQALEERLPEGIVNGQIEALMAGDPKRMGQAAAILKLQARRGSLSLESVTRLADAMENDGPAAVFAAQILLLQQNLPEQAYVKLVREFLRTTDKNLSFEIYSRIRDQSQDLPDSALNVLRAASSDDLTLKRRIGDILGRRWQGSSASAPLAELQAWMRAKRPVRVRWTSIRTKESQISRGRISSINNQIDISTLLLDSLESGPIVINLKMISAAAPIPKAIFWALRAFQGLQKTWENRRKTIRDAALRAVQACSPARIAGGIRQLAAGPIRDWQSRRIKRAIRALRPSIAPGLPERLGMDALRALTRLWGKGYEEDDRRILQELNWALQERRYEDPSQKGFKRQVISFAQQAARSKTAGTEVRKAAWGLLSSYWETNFRLDDQERAWLAEYWPPALDFAALCDYFDLVQIPEVKAALDRVSHAARAALKVEAYDGLRRGESAARVRARLEASAARMESRERELSWKPTTGVELEVMERTLRAHLGIGEYKREVYAWNDVMDFLAQELGVATAHDELIEYAPKPGYEWRTSDALIHALKRSGMIPEAAGDHAKLHITVVHAKPLLIASRLEEWRLHARTIAFLEGVLTASERRLQEGPAHMTSLRREDFEFNDT